MTSGFGGAGAYSDGKYNITTEFGNNRLVVGYDGENESKSSNFTTIINNNSKFTSPAENARLVRKEFELYQLKHGDA